MDQPIINYLRARYSHGISTPSDEDMDHEIESQLGETYLHDVSRIYIECASQGDLQNWIREKRTATYPSEEYIWRMWECLLKGLMVLKHGTEDPQADLTYEGAKHWHTPIGHFDLKGPNSEFFSGIGGMCASC